MVVIYAVQLGVSYHSDSYKQEIIRTYPFITHSALAGTCLVGSERTMRGRHLRFLPGEPFSRYRTGALVQQLRPAVAVTHAVGLQPNATIVCCDTVTFVTWQRPQPGSVHGRVHVSDGMHLAISALLP
jgi:hypothetical protein